MISVGSALTTARAFCTSCSRRAGAVPVRAARPPAAGLGNSSYSDSAQQRCLRRTDCHNGLRACASASCASLRHVSSKQPKASRNLPASWSEANPICSLASIASAVAGRVHLRLLPAQHNDHWQAVPHQVGSRARLVGQRAQCTVALSHPFHSHCSCTRSLPAAPVRTSVVPLYNCAATAAAVFTLHSHSSGVPRL